MDYRLQTLHDLSKRRKRVLAHHQAGYYASQGRQVEHAANRLNWGQQNARWRAAHDMPTVRQGDRFSKMPAPIPSARPRRRRRPRSQLA